eukprot:7149850-Prymnesium_polylepis.1
MRSSPAPSPYFLSRSAARSGSERCAVIRMARSMAYRPSGPATQARSRDGSATVGGERGGAARGAARGAAIGRAVKGCGDGSPASRPGCRGRAAAGRRAGRG